MSRVLDSALVGRNPVVALSGPNIAAEVAKGVPTATVVASLDEDAARYAQRLFMSSSLRVYTNSDVIGVELAGALKNIIAIAAGICDGMGLGDNTKAALLTRGLAEITRLGVRMGAQQATFMGLAGIGDLIVTCASPLSRNHRVGIGLGLGGKLEDVLNEIGQVAEGVPTTRAAYRLAQESDTPMPITEQMHQVLFEGKPPRAAVADLMSREPKDEVW
jgi:glycerol-3-phosphate dehydrogenase (NAD(P)+)